MTVPLNQQKDTKDFVICVLKICDLDVEKFEKLSPPPSPKRSNFYPQSSGIRYTVDDNEEEFTEESDFFNFKVRKAKEDESIVRFIRKNLDLAQIRTKSLEELKEEIQELKTDLQEKLKLEEIVYNCGWNFEHFRGCLKSLEKLHDLYSDEMHNLRDKTVTFSMFTGVSLDGGIHLYTGDVQTNWLDVSDFEFSFVSKSLSLVFLYF